MAITNTELFSIDIKNKVTEQECLLWERFRNQQGPDWISFHPTSEWLPKWGTKVERYTSTNCEYYLPILNRICEEMKQQNETFCEILPQKDETTRKLTLSAISQLEKHDPELGYALRMFVGRILIVDCADLVASSSILFLGLIIIAPKPWWTLYDYMENIIHEMSHIELYIKQFIDPMVIKGSYLQSPFRENLRPTNCVFHATFVLARIISRLRPFALQQDDSSPLNVRLRQCSELLDKSLSQLNDPSKLTPSGIILLNEITELSITQRNVNYATI
ncbi:hypothetical protein RAL73_002194 [Vibrio cholerae]|uniref:aKG-HExxH-type peptide beta-hydroxylase n=1 Tax=Vibrio cholerae TaxID=666 RepID=UPI001E15D45D|nr:hypothetical protein [Vibrio cholerae]EHV9953268.1 hypothetical protein [Vibrio cholerae]ELG4676622.1 hypothetical protein [Vibrio cholerae]